MIKQDYQNIKLQLREVLIDEIDRRLSALPPIIPCKVVSKSGPTVTVLPTVNLGFSPKPITGVPIAKSKYRNDPLKTGDKGMLIPCAYLFDSLILHPAKAQIANPIPSPNLGGYMFFPLSDEDGDYHGAGEVEAIYSQSGNAYMALNSSDKATIKNGTTDLKTLLQAFCDAVITAVNSVSASTTVTCETGETAIPIKVSKDTSAVTAAKANLLELLY